MTNSHQHESLARQRQQKLYAGQKVVLEMIAHGEPLANTLVQLALAIETQSDGLMCSVLLLDEDGIHIRVGAGPHLPAEYMQALDGYAIGPAVGSCGTAMYRRETVIVTDIATDPLWAPYKALALPHGLRACWSSPIALTGGGVLGTFAMYYGEVRSPDDSELRLLEVATHLASIAIERDRHERALRQLNAELEARVTARTAQLQVANQELEAFTYSVSHDLRAPLRAIDGFVAALVEEEQQRLGDTGKHYLSRIQSSVARLAALINVFLDLSRISSAPLNYQEIDLTALAQEILADLQHSDLQHADLQYADSRPVNSARVVSLDIAAGLHVRGDPDLVRVLLTNLLGNAWKYTGKKSDARIALHAEQHDHKTVFVVTDNGAGFDADKADKLFMPFQRLHQQSEFEGVGIGLATCRRIVQRHGGKLWAQSQPGEGARFYFSLSS